ncbi:hypothetical protein PF005_g28385 [Phytophthora fragariae]|uniref:Uncharacterized protein n=1 Tax=Phytophthora fragariae TaxID=53985 RepID=A0A6A3VWC0_9STRA|nr:hypothetical protein PF003_g24664 [Phytophthora fragariae]KAE9066022.1 hypothetical protein PF010_g27970 [Phytophthora fragariae]KAE9066691.1 hypothetical protein PF007_g28348 [Phytophthora fragariae]KAE9077012.1 hypothetical protein PF006_g28008 [Phytophthora fragariae]KAE9168422.1 hypothetical protein PF005_g28385 [Phytophthora fragariae]
MYTLDSCILQVPYPSLFVLGRFWPLDPEDVHFVSSFPLLLLEVAPISSAATLLLKLVSAVLVSPAAAANLLLLSAALLAAVANLLLLVVSAVLFSLAAGANLLLLLLSAALILPAAGVNSLLLLVSAALVLPAASANLVLGGSGLVVDGGKTAVAADRVALVSAGDRQGRLVMIYLIHDYLSLNVVLRS